MELTMRRAVLSSVAALLALSGATAMAAPTDELRALVEKGRSAEAYAVGKLLPGAPGDPQFDYYFGVAAIDSGHAADGVIALERFLARFPADDQARFDLARGYYALGDLPRARDEFERVIGHRPQPDRQATIERFLDSIQAQASRHPSASSMYLELGLGVDSNLARGIGGTAPNEPLLDDLLPVAGGAKNADSFALAGAGARFTRPLAPSVSLQGGLSYAGKYQFNSFDKQFDQQALGGYGGLTLLRGSDLYRANLSYSTLVVDTGRYRNVSALGGEWRRQLDELNTLSLYAQYAALDYPAAPAADSDFYALGAGWRRAIVQRYQPIVRLQALYGREKNAGSPMREDLSRELYSLRAGLSTSPWPGWGLSGGVSYTTSRYGAPDPVFAANRDENYYGLDAGLSYRWSRRLTLRADFLHSDNRSNLESYKFARDVLTLRVHYDLQ
jgi:hypothetical protein